MDRVERLAEDAVAHRQPPACLAHGSQTRDGAVGSARNLHRELGADQLAEETGEPRRRLLRGRVVRLFRPPSSPSDERAQQRSGRAARPSSTDRSATSRRRRRRRTSSRRSGRRTRRASRPIARGSSRNRLIASPTGAAKAVAAEAAQDAGEQVPCEQHLGLLLHRRSTGCRVSGPVNMSRIWSATMTRDRGPHVDGRHRRERVEERPCRQAERERRRRSA